jgi:thioester reductase-like protein
MEEYLCSAIVASMIILVTGASGNLGTEIAYALVQAGHGVICALHSRAELVRNSGTALPFTCDRLEDLRPGLIVGISLDITQRELGIAQSTRVWLAENLDLVVHSAAVTDFGLSEEVYESVNVRGTANVVSFLASSTRKLGLIHISTAYVAGFWDGLFREDDFESGQEFGNPYEWSKFEGEKIVRAAMASGLAAVIVRPSIIVGDALTGQIRDFRHLYPLLRVVGAGRVRSMAGRYDACVDLVPIDYVTNGIAAIADRFSDCLGQTLHAVSGAPLTVRDMSEVLAEFPSMCVPRILPPATFDRSRMPASERAYYERLVQLFEAYFVRTVEFRASRFRRLVVPAPLPEAKDVFRKLVRYGQRAGYFGPANMEVKQGHYASA